MKYKIYTDGSCHGNPGPGGWAYLIHNEEKIISENSGYSEDTTNNKMELTAIIEAIAEIQVFTNVSAIQLFTDSKYAIDGINSWIHAWKKNNWRTSSKKEVKNINLWKQLDIYNSNLNIEWIWVKGHSGDPFNDKVDAMANLATLNKKSL